VEAILHEADKKELEFTVRKANGEVRSVRLFKVKIRSDENAVKGYILKGAKKIGYISLPSFYTDWGTNTPLGCANDVAREIVKLEQEHIEGLVLDLRFNGGGSVREAIDLAGIFIDEGPLSIYRSRNQKPLLLKDMNRGTAYDGPLVVLVNGLSASASELFAGIIQNYNRGMIVGSPTYGKATGQEILPLDTIFSFTDLFASRQQASRSERKNFGFVKVTVEQFYNLHNGTHQKTGIQPDLKLPEPFYFGQYREALLPYALPADSVKKTVYYNPLPALPLSKLVANSQLRLAQNPNFKRFGRVNDSLIDLRKKGKPLLLKPDYFRKEEKSGYQLIEALGKCISDSSTVFVARNNEYEQKLIDIDTYNKDINEVVLKNIQQDLYLDETYRILLDYLMNRK
jgi:carboxyl-terminal processing protease